MSQPHVADLLQSYADYCQLDPTSPAMDDIHNVLASIIVPSQIDQPLPVQVALAALLAALSARQFVGALPLGPQSEPGYHASLQRHRQEAAATPASWLQATITEPPWQPATPAEGWTNALLELVDTHFPASPDEDDPDD